MYGVHALVNSRMLPARILLACKVNLKDPPQGGLCSSVAVFVEREPDHRDRWKIVIPFLILICFMASEGGGNGAVIAFVDFLRLANLMHGRCTVGSSSTKCEVLVRFSMHEYPGIFNISITKLILNCNWGLVEWLRSFAWQP